MCMKKEWDKIIKNASSTIWSAHFHGNQKFKATGAKVLPLKGLTKNFLLEILMAKKFDFQEQENKAIYKTW